MYKKMLAIFLLVIASASAAMPLDSQYALVVEEGSGKVLLEKNADKITPIASLTKLMTAMVILDSKPDMDAVIRIDRRDVDTIKHSSSRVPVGATLSRRVLLQLALMSSDNRAAAALARTYPGGMDAFSAAVAAKLHALGMTHTCIEEPTGLSAKNTSSAADLVRMATAAARYPAIARITTDSMDTIKINGRPVVYRNTNALVGKDGWKILLSKTGFTKEAGRCIILRIKSEEKNVIVVLLNATARSARTLDAANVRRFVLRDTATVVRSSRDRRA